MSEGTPGHSPAPFAEIYDRHLVPMIFEPYAMDITQRLGALEPTRVLEIAASTVGGNTHDGGATATVGGARGMIDTRPRWVPPARWSGRWPSLNLPFPDDGFDAVVQFGVMFFPDHTAGCRRPRSSCGRMVPVQHVGPDRAQRLRPRGVRCTGDEVPDDPPKCHRLTGAGYFQPEQIRADLAAAGFRRGDHHRGSGCTQPCAERRIVAQAYCYGTPTGTSSKDAARQLAAAATTAERAVAKTFGRTDLDGRGNARVRDRRTGTGLTHVRRVRARPSPRRVSTRSSANARCVSRAARRTSSCSSCTRRADPRMLRSGRR